VKARAAVTGSPTRRQAPRRAYHRGFYCYIANLRGYNRSAPRLGSEYCTIEILPKTKIKKERGPDAYFQVDDVFIRRWDGEPFKLTRRGGYYVLIELPEAELDKVQKEKQALERILKWETHAYCSIRKKR
jgi:hypothetical protein